MIHESVRSLLAGTKWGAAVIVVLGIALCTSKTVGPILEPFLVGRWEAPMASEGNPGHRKARHISLSLYDDNVALLDGVKGSWRLADISRPIVLIEMPRQDKTGSLHHYELKLYRQDDPLRLSGTMKHSGELPEFNQVEQVELLVRS